MVMNYVDMSLLCHRESLAGACSREWIPRMPLHEHIPHKLSIIKPCKSWIKVVIRWCYDVVACDFVNFKAELRRAEVESHYDEPLWTRRIQEKRARFVYLSFLRSSLIHLFQTKALTLKDSTRFTKLYNPRSTWWQECKFKLHNQEPMPETGLPELF